jgi:hypothetical protein
MSIHRSGLVRHLLRQVLGGDEVTRQKGNVITITLIKETLLRCWAKRTQTFATSQDIFSLNNITKNLGWSSQTFDKINILREKGDEITTVFWEEICFTLLRDLFYYLIQEYKIRITKALNNCKRLYYFGLGIQLPIQKWMNGHCTLLYIHVQVLVHSQILVIA